MRRRFLPWRRRPPLIVAPAVRTRDDITCDVHVDGTSFPVRFSAPDVRPPPRDDPFVAPALLLGMKLGRDVRMEGRVSRAVLDALPEVQGELRAWYPKLAAVDVQVAEILDPPERPDTGATAAFFSGGLDSFFTAIEGGDLITHLVFVHGFDIALEDTTLRERVGAEVRRAAAAMGKTLVEVETDLRRLSDPHANWVWYSVAGLVAVSQLLADTFDRILVPVTIADAHRPPELRTGDRPSPWRTAHAVLESSGAGATRPQKARRVADLEAARRALRVCWENREGAYNCGHCDKCLRTQVDLEVAGVRHLFPDFTLPLDLDAVRRLPTTRPSDCCFLEEALWMAEERGEEARGAAAVDPALVEALRAALAKRRGM